MAEATTPPPSHTTQRRQLPLLGWMWAALLGLRDTAKAMLEEAREGAREGYEEGWRRYEERTRRQRRHR